MTHRYYIRKNEIMIVGFLLLLIYTIIFFIDSQKSSITLDEVGVLGLFAFAQFVYTIFSLYKMRRTWFDPYIIFTSVIYAFMLSQPILEAFGIPSSYRRLWGDFGISNRTYYNATYYSMVAILFFHFGMVLCVPINSRVGYRKTQIFNRLQSLKSLRIGAVIIALVSMPFFLKQLFTQFIIVQTVGYAGLYNWEEYTSRSAQIIAEAFVPSILALFCISIITGKYFKLTGLVFLSLVFLPPFFLGGRSNAMISLAVFIIVYASVYPISKKQIFIICGLGIFMLIAMNIVGKIRNGTDRSLDAVETVSKNNEDNAAVSTLEEMGWSMYTTALSIDAIPSKYDHSYGSSYFWAGVSIIPNLGFWDGVHPGKLNDPGYKLNEYANMGYGIGYSIVAGTYNEFGYFGFIIMFFYGIIFSKIFSYISATELRRNPVKYIIAILILWFSIKFVRNSFDSFIRNVVYYVFPFYILSKCTFKIKNKETEKVSDKDIQCSYRALSD